MRLDIFSNGMITASPYICTKKELRDRIIPVPELRSTAAAYSPSWYASTIGDGGLNFSVRYGKRWDPAAIAAAVISLERSLLGHDSITERFRGISTGRLWRRRLCASRLSTS
jgi:hypothetical protein